MKAVKLQTESADLVVDELNWETCFVKLKLGMYSVFALEIEKGTSWTGGKSMLYLHITAASIALAHKEASQTKF